MKKLMMIVIALVTLNTIAQDKKDKKDFLKELSAEEKATLKTKKLTLHLDLTDSQQASVKSLFLNEAEFREKQSAEREEKKKDDDSKKPTKEERYAMANERLDRQIEMKKQMKSILNPEQYKKWEASLSKNKRGHRKEGRNDQRSGKRN